MTKIYLMKQQVFMALQMTVLKENMLQYSFLIPPIDSGSLPQLALDKDKVYELFNADMFGNFPSINVDFRNCRQ